MRSAGVVGTARRKGGSGNRGRPVKGEGSGLNVAKGGGHGGSRTGSYDRRSRVMLAEERALTSGALSKMARSWGLAMSLQTPSKTGAAGDCCVEVKRRVTHRAEAACG